LFACLNQPLVRVEHEHHEVAVPEQYSNSPDRDRLLERMLFLNPSPEEWYRKRAWLGQVSPSFDADVTESLPGRRFTARTVELYRKKERKTSSAMGRKERGLPDVLVQPIPVALHRNDEMRSLPEVDRGG